jgi:hypothetical protein
MEEGKLPDEGEDDELLEDSEYSRKSEFSKATLTQGQVERCLSLRSKDMRPGYTTWKIDKNGSAHPEIVPDSRKEYISAVEALLNLLAPETELKFSGLLEEYEKEKKKVFEKYAYRERIGRRYDEKLQKVVWVYANEIYMPQKGAKLLGEDPSSPRSVKSLVIPELWDNKIDAYWDGILELADMLFANLNRLIHALDYFKGGTSF